MKQTPELILHEHIVNVFTTVSCEECKKPLDWHKSFGEWCADAFGKGTWQDYVAKELKDDVSN